MPSIFGIACEDIVDDTIDLEQLSPVLNDLLLSLHETRKTRTETVVEMYKIIKLWALSSLNKYQLPLYGIRAVELIRRCGGNVSQRKLAEHLDISDRHLRRTVQKLIGRSPKALSRNLRFLNALKYADTTPRLSWSECAASFGYFDQAHLINEFRAISEFTPNQLMNARLSESVFSNSSESEIGILA